MLNKTRCSIAPFPNSGKPITPEVMTKILTNWALLADAVENGLHLAHNECLVWAISLYGGGNTTPWIRGVKEDPPHAITDVSRCEWGYSPVGATLIQGGTTNQSMLVSKVYDQATILVDGFGQKSTGPKSIQIVVDTIVARLSKT